MDVGAHHGIEAPDAGDHLEVGQLPLVHEFLYRGFEEEFHPADLDHFLQVVVDPMVFCKELLVQGVDHAGGGAFEVDVEKVGEHDNRSEDGNGEDQENFQKVCLEDSQFQH